MLKRTRQVLLGLGLGLGLAVIAHAHGYKVGELYVGHPWARATVAGQGAGGGFLKIENKGKTSDRLVGGQSPVADHVELHTMTMEGDVMKMRAIEAIDLPAGQTVELKPGALHVMFIGLKAPLKAGDKVPLTLKFEKAGEVKVEVRVEKGTAGADEHKQHEGMHQ